MTNERDLGDRGRRRATARRLGADRPKAFVRLGGRPLVAHCDRPLRGPPGASTGSCSWCRPGGRSRRRSSPTSSRPGKVAAVGRRRARRGRSRSRPAWPRWPTPRARSWCTTPPGRSPRRTLVDRVLAALETHDGAVPALPVSDTVKRVRDGRVGRDARPRRARARCRRRRRSGPTALRRAYVGPGRRRLATRPTARRSSSGRAAPWWRSPGERGRTSRSPTADDLARAEARLVQ